MDVCIAGLAALQTRTNRLVGVVKFYFRHGPSTTCGTSFFVYAP